MQKIRLDKDIRPLSEFRSRIAAFLEQVRKTGRPLVLTQHGKGVAVLLDVAEFDRLVEAVELIEDIRVADAQAARGETLSHREVMRRARKAIG